jgi:hypothetical protein
MATPMTIYRLEDLSMNYWVRGIFLPYNAQITYTDEFPEQVLTIPTVSIANGKISEEEFELGDSDGIRIRRWFIDIFAVNKSQRDDFGYLLLSECKKGINVLDYNEGFPPDASPTVINHLDVISRTYEPIDVIRQLNEKLYYRGQLILITKNDKV